MVDSFGDRARSKEEGPVVIADDDWLAVKHTEHGHFAKRSER